MSRSWLKIIVRIAFNCIMSFFLVELYKYWTAIPRTNPHTAKAICLFVIVLIVIMWLDLFKNKVMRGIKKVLVILGIGIIVVTNTVLSGWYLSIQSKEWQVLYYSSVFEPNGDLAMLQLLLEEKTLVVDKDESYYNLLFERLGEETVFVDMDTEEIIGQYEFEDMGHVRSLHVMYGELFDLEYDGETVFPHLYVSPDIKADNDKRYVFSDANNNIYIFESDIDYAREN